MSLKYFKKVIYNQIRTIQYVLGRTKKYFPGKEKSRLQILKDLLAWQINEGEFNSMYYAMGLHLVGANQNEYIGRRTFLRIKNRVENKLKQKCGSDKLNYDVITKDKFYANSIFSGNNIPCIQNLALISGGYLIFPDGKTKNIESIIEFEAPFIIKNVFLEAGEGVFLCRVGNRGIEINGEKKDIDFLKNLLGNKIWVLQSQYLSHSILKKINSSALNTTRIVTILNGREPEYICGFQGFATCYASTDSWRSGSVYVGIDIEKECLGEYGLTSTSDKRPGILTKHPDSGIIFKDFPIPCLKEAIDLCIRVHRILYFNFIIGWDVAITDSGPLIVEANEKPGMNVAQSFNGGLRKKIMSYAGKILQDKYIV